MASGKSPATSSDRFLSKEDLKKLELGILP